MKTAILLLSLIALAAAPTVAAECQDIPDAGTVCADADTDPDDGTLGLAASAEAGGTFTAQITANATF